MLGFIGDPIGFFESLGLPRAAAYAIAVIQIIAVCFVLEPSNTSSLDRLFFGNQPSA